MRTIAALIMIIGLVGPASAAAITYRGTMGDIPIGLELTEPEDRAVVGRYFRFADGFDIPLQSKPSLAGQFVLAEEGPCDETVCIRDDEDDVVTKLPIDAIWTLQLSSDRQVLTGTRLDSATSEILQIQMERVGERVLAPNVETSPYTLHDGAMQEAYRDTGGFNAASLPYDFLKFDIAMMHGDTQMMDGSSFIYVTDPRTKFAFPQLKQLSDSSDVAAANRTLSIEHARMSLEALDCKSAIYMGFGWSRHLHEYAGTLAFFDEEKVEVTYLSPTVMSWNQSGELFCTGVVGTPHSDSYNLDVKSGTSLNLSKILSHVSARSISDPEESPNPALVQLHGEYFWEFDNELQAWLLANLAPSDNPPAVHSELESWLLANLAVMDNPPTDDSCVVEDLIPGHIAVHFAAGDRIVFALEKLDYYTFMCSRDLRSVPLVDIPEQLAPDAVEFFPGLRGHSLK